MGRMAVGSRSVTHMGQLFGRQKSALIGAAPIPSCRHLTTALPWAHTLPSRIHTMALPQAVTVLVEHDAATRKQLANRAHVMRDALVASRSRVRQAAEASRRHRVEVGHGSGCQETPLRGIVENCIEARPG